MRILISMLDMAEFHFDFLSEREAVFTQSVMDRLADEAWASSLLQQIRENGGLTKSNKSLLFELRFAFALFQAGISSIYEIEGERQSTLDFGFSHAGTTWKVELMRLEETEAVRSATQTTTDGDGFEVTRRLLSSSADDARQSEHGETLKAVQRICQKCERNGRAHKFPLPDNCYHLLLIDFRTFLNGGDQWDRVHVGLGGESVTPEYCRRYWGGTLISGVFDERTISKGAEFAQSRVHLLGFVNETEFADGAFGAAIQFISNPNLLGSQLQREDFVERWPLNPAVLLNRN
jgi:hypothetical protein